MAFKLTREESIPKRPMQRSAGGQEIMDTIREFCESDMDLASIDFGEDSHSRKIEQQLRYYCRMHFDGRVKVMRRNNKTYLQKI